MPESLTVVIDSCGSTNAELAKMPDAPHGLVIAARRQTAGRGQRGNSWESEPDANLTFSILFRTGLEARRQFELSMLVSLAVVRFVNELIAPLSARVKWPNDIYVGDRKICGILIEHSLMGRELERSIAGIGINLNQREFLSDAPNPVSVVQLSGVETDLQSALERVGELLREEVDSYMAQPDAELLHARYMAVLWRGHGRYLFREPQGEPFEASIIDVGHDGMLSLDNGKSYAFKEISYIL